MKTLFNPPIENNRVKDINFFELPHYSLARDIQLLKMGEHYILVRPKTGSWVVLENNEIRIFRSPSKSIKDPKIGEFLYKRGICTKNGFEVDFLTTSNFTEELYFFEFCVTNRCNLSCKYCFADAGINNSSEKDDATIDIGEIFVDRIAEFKAKTHSQTPFIIEFTGGEPLLNFKLIRHVVEYTKRQYSDLLGIRFIIQSNITSLTTEQLKFIKNEEIGLGISCDGFKNIQDSQRPFLGGKGSHTKLIRNLKKIRELYPKNTGCVIAVVTDRSQDFMPELFLYLHTLGFHEIALRPKAEIGRGLSSDLGSPSPDKYVDGLFYILDSVIEPLFIENNVIVKERHLSLTFQHLLDPYRTFMCEKNPCGAAKNICITMPNGDVYPCNQSVIEESLFLGNIKKDSFHEILKNKTSQKLRERNIENIDGCKDCVFRGWCGSPCPITAIRKSGKINDKSAYCEILKKRYQIGLKRLIEERYDPLLIMSLSNLNYPIRWESIT